MWGTGKINDVMGQSSKRVISQIKSDSKADVLKSKDKNISNRKEAEGGIKMTKKSNKKLDNLSSGELMKLAVLVCKKMINKQATMYNELAEENASLSKIAGKHIYNIKLTNMATKMAEAGMILESEIPNQVDFLRGKYASINDIPDVDIFFGEFDKLARGLGSPTGEDNSDDNDATVNFCNYLKS